mmetsp:Transcript_19065/g.31237  ORF Transcript_19065/g.31237 Transcript_19065/m.31237 type:complete len:94 (+) Transcript_19065:570-851(+)
MAPEDVTCLLVGNKADLIGKRVVQAADAEALAKECGMLYIETSAKTNTNIKEAFMTITRQVKQRVVDPALLMRSTQGLPNPPSRPPACKCVCS